MRFTKRNVIVKLESRVIIRIPLIMAELIWSRDGSFLLSLSTVPEFFWEEDVDEYKSNNNGRYNYNRDGPLRKRLCGLEGKHAEIVGRCTSYRFRVSAVDIVRKVQSIKTICERLTVVPYDLPILKTPPPDLQGSTIQELAADLAQYTRDNSLPFEILFQLQALAYNAFLHPGRVRALARELRSLFVARKAEGRSPLPLDAVRRLFSMISKPTPHPPSTELDSFRAESLLESILENEKQIIHGLAHRRELQQQTENLTYVHRIHVSPTRISLHGPEMEPLNRILRKYPNHHDYFLRVQFSDENGDDLFFNHRVSYQDVFTRFKNVLTVGVQIAGRVYTFLGFSHSSLRSHTAWASIPTLYALNYYS